jgi:hypothetical protein
MMMEISSRRVKLTVKIKNVNKMSTKMMRLIINNLLQYSLLSIILERGKFKILTVKKAIK